MYLPMFFLRPEKRLSVQLVRWAATATALEPRSGGRPLMLGRPMGSEEKRWIYWFFIHGGLEWAIFHSRLLKQPEGYIRQS